MQPSIASAATERALKLWVVLSRAYAAVEAHARADIARHGLSMAEFGALEALYHKGPMLLGELKQKILVSSGGTTYVVDRLEQKGLAERRQCAEDRRATYAELTPQGRQWMERVFPQHARRLEAALSGLDAEEQQAAVGLLRTLGRAAQQRGDTEQGA